MSCGHPVECIVSSDEGTAYCAMCALEAERDMLMEVTRCAKADYETMRQQWQVACEALETAQWLPIHWREQAFCLISPVAISAVTLCARELDAVLGASAVLRTPRSWRIISELPPYSELRCKICDAPFDSCNCIVSPYKDSGELFGVKYELKRARDLLKKALSAFQGADVLPAGNAALAAAPSDELAQERARCARIADAVAEDFCADPDLPSGCQAARTIADAIRSGEAA